MSERLSRETCEALAKAFPAVASHRIEYGEAFYRQLGYPSVFADETDIADGENWPGDGCLWCPRLEDLLALAKSLCVDSESPDLWWGEPYELDAEGAPAQCWRYSVEPGPDAQFRLGTHGDTPSAAVAVWLLARAGERA